MALQLRKRADTSGDRLEDGSWPVAGVEIVGDPPEYHIFADSFVARAYVEGWLSFDNLHVEAQPGYSRSPVITGDAIRLHLTDGEVVYRIIRTPGLYLADGEDYGEPTTTPGEGTAILHGYECELSG